MTDLREAIARAIAGDNIFKDAWLEWLEEADAALAAIEATGYTLCPPGWQCVPKEPTLEMNRVLATAVLDGVGSDKALQMAIAAAPKP